MSGFNKLILIFFLIIVAGCNNEITEINNDQEINLPAPIYDSSISVEKALSERKSVRNYRDEALDLAEVSQLLWAAQGIDAVTRATRTAPSAGATHPLETYVAVNNVAELERGVYHYNPQEHSLNLVKKMNNNDKVPIYIIITAVYDRTTEKYSNRGIQYVHYEVGHAAQNIHLQAISLGLGSYPIGAFNENEVKNFGLKEDHIPLYIIPVGKYDE